MPTTRTRWRISDLLGRIGVTLPIIQAPMAGVSSPAMAAAVSQAGGLGSIAIGATDTSGARDMIAAVRARRPGRSDGLFNVNVFCHRPARPDAERETAWIERLRPEFERHGGVPPAALTPIYRSFLEDDEMLALLLAERPTVVSFHFGLPAPERVHALHRAGIVMLASATTLAEGRAIEAAGVDAVIAQGHEAGGHRGMFNPDAADDMLDTLTLTRLLARELAVPVIAAGGMMNGAGIATALRLGAVACQLGTAFIACDESLADSAYRAALFGPPAHHTLMTRAISGRPARCLANLFTRLGAGVPTGDIPDYPIAYDAGKALHATAKAAGEFGFAAHWAGQGAARARAMPAADLVATLAAEVRNAR